MLNVTETGSSDSSTPAELSAFTKVAAAIQDLDPSVRPRFFRTLATFFGLESEVPVSRPTTTSRASNQSSSFSEDRSLGPKEFMRAKIPQTDIERVISLAYYLTHYRGTPHFKTLDLSKLNTEAAQIKFSNAAQAVDNATKAGLLVPATKGQKQISALGELYVQALPDRQAARDAVSQARPKRGRPRGKSERRGPKETLQIDPN
jgi:hypothetical protein